jgi:opacity protein-like surface antigen
MAAAPSQSLPHHDGWEKTKQILRFQGESLQGAIDVKRLTLGVAAALTLGAGQAAAEGLPSRSAVRGPEVAGTTSWTGFYIGAGIGGGAQALSLRPTPGTSDFGGEGGFGTVVLGYDHLIGPRWVAGVFADFDLSEISGKFASLNFDHNYSWSVGARLGALVNPTTLLYGTAGYTQAEFELSGFLNDVNAFEGYFVGAGIETFLRENWALKLEYRFSDFGEDQVLASGNFLDPSLHTARLVLSYKLGHRDMGAVPDPDEVASPGWTGFYIGVGFGGGALPLHSADGGIDFAGEGPLGTVVLGYDHVLRAGWIAGLFGDFEVSGISGGTSSEVNGNRPFDHNYSWSVGARLGRLVNPATLLYGTAGYTQAELEASGTLSDSNTFDGYFVGAGIETFLRENWAIKLEYRFSDFGEDQIGGIRVDPSLHTARLVLTYKFGHRD